MAASLILRLTNCYNMLIEHRFSSNVGGFVARSHHVRSSSSRDLVFISIVNAKHAVIPLFFASPNWQNSRIPARVERSFADNFLQKQRGPFKRGGLGKICRSKSLLAEEGQGEGIP
jgi:hypothetical protein